MTVFALANASITDTLYSTVPGWMLRPFHYYDTEIYFSIGALLILAAIAGFICGWSLRQRFRNRFALAVACIVMPLFPGLVRWLLGACTDMDIDMAAVLTVSTVLGARRPAYPDDGFALDFKERWLRPLLCILVSIVLIIFGTWSWNGNGVVTDVKYSVSDLSDSENMAFYTEWRDKSSKDMELMYGEGWRDDFNELLKSPEKYSVVKFDLKVTNRSLRRMHTTCVYFDTGAVNYGTDVSMLRENMLTRFADDYVYASPAPLKSETVSLHYIIATSDLPEGEALDDALSELGKCFTVLH